MLTKGRRVYNRDETGKIIDWVIEPLPTAYQNALARSAFRRLNPGIELPPIDAKELNKRKRRTRAQIEYQNRKEGN